jgi:uncharacterized protein (DUF2252 family)
MVATPYGLAIDRRVNENSASPRRTVAERRHAGADLRKDVPRSAQADWVPPPNRGDPVALLQAQGRTRIAALLPIRYQRMRPSPFTFLRGAAAVMAEDLASTVSSGLRVQSSGDCHLANFGSYASPDGLPVFDLNDFDETLPAPFEWDLKRLASSLVLAGRDRKMPEGACEDLAFMAAHAYGRAINQLAAMAPLEAWSSRIDLGAAVTAIAKSRIRTQENRRLEIALKGSKTGYGLAVHEGGGWRIREKLPQVRRLHEHELPTRAMFETYAATLAPERRVLLDRYKLRDVAFKIVGIGSVGTFCAIGLFTDADGNPLMLQIKQAQDSVLAPYAGPSAFANQGERVVVGQRMLQATTDIFLGWTQPQSDARHFYVRRLKDSRLAAVGETMESALGFYADLCGRTLARAHARTGDAAAIAGYVGTGPSFAKAISDFAVAYAKQTTRDWRQFCAAIASGLIEAHEP